MHHVGGRGEVRSVVIPNTSALLNPPRKPSNLGRVAAHRIGERRFHARAADRYCRRAEREDATEAASHDGNLPAGGSFTTRAERTPGQAATAATASGEGS